VLTVEELEQPIFTGVNAKVVVCNCHQTKSSNSEQHPMTKLFGARIAGVF